MDRPVDSAGVALDLLVVQQQKWAEFEQILYFGGRRMIEKAVWPELFLDDGPLPVRKVLA